MSSTYSRGFVSSVAPQSATVTANESSSTSCKANPRRIWSSRARGESSLSASSRLSSLRYTPSTMSDSMPVPCLTRSILIFWSCLHAQRDRQQRLAKGGSEARSSADSQQRCGKPCGAFDFRQGTDGVLGSLQPDGIGSLSHHLTSRVGPRSSVVIQEVALVQLRVSDKGGMSNAHP